MELEGIVNEEMLTTEDVNNMLEHTDKGRTKQTIRNCVTVLQNDPVLKKAVKRNELSGRMDIVKEVPWERRNNSPTVTDTDENNLKMYLEENYELTSERVIKAGVDIVSNENKYHPIRDYLESLVWDGIPRIENMLPHFLGAKKKGAIVIRETPEKFKLEDTTIWSFPERGNWATPVSYTHLDVYKRQISDCFNIKIQKNTYI